MRRWLVWIVVATPFAALTLDVSAQEALVWKLKAGDNYDLHVEQQTTSTVTVVNKVVKTIIEMTLDSVWTVENVENGTAKIKQTVSRVQVKVQAADAAPIAFDTAAPGQTSGAQKELSAAVRPLVDPESSITLVMNERGEITSAELSPKLAKLWDAGKQGETDKRGPTNESLDALLKQPLVILPAKQVAMGDKWTASRELTTPAGKFTQKVEYTYDGRKPTAGAAADAISFASTLVPAATGKSKIKEQSQTGTVLFDGQAGRLISGDQTQKLVTETPYREATITVVVESQVKRTLTPK